MSERKRPDRAAKFKERKHTIETVVKASLRKHICLDGITKTIACQLIEKRVMECSKRTRNASLALNLLIRLLSDKTDVKTIVYPKFWDTTFVRQLLLGTKDAKKPVQAIKELENNYPQLFPELERSIGDSNIYSFAAIKLATNIKNHLRLNLRKVIKKYICLEVEDEDDQVDAMYQAFGWNTEKKRKGKKDATTIKSFQVATVIRDVLELEKGDEIDLVWLNKDANLPKIMRMFIHVNRMLEASNKKLFNILPICKIRAHFITIDTSSMIPMLKELGLLDLNVDIKNIDCKSLWESFIDVSKMKNTRNVFTGTIDTDGIAVNVHFKRPKIDTSKQNIDLKGKRVLAVDPGRVNIFSIVEKEDNERFKQYVFTKKHYYTVSGITKATKRSQHWNKSVKDELSKISLNSPKSTNVDNFHRYISALNDVEDALWKVYLHRKWRDQTLRLYGGKKRAFANFLNRLNLDENTVVAFGSAKFAPTGKGELSCPTTRAYKEMSYRSKTILIDEYRTSKVHWEDDSILEKVNKPNLKKGGYKTVRGLLWCGSTNFNKFVNRDMNAAINIWRCGMMYPSRPPSLTRMPDHKKIVQRVGCIIPK